jgi:hypothetical protein
MEELMKTRWPNGAIFNSVFKISKSISSSNAPSTALCTKCFLYCCIPIDVIQVPTSAGDHRAGGSFSSCAWVRLGTTAGCTRCSLLLLCPGWADLGRVADNELPSSLRLAAGSADRGLSKPRAFIVVCVGEPTSAA